MKGDGYFRDPEMPGKDNELFDKGIYCGSDKTGTDRGSGFDRCFDCRPDKTLACGGPDRAHRSRRDFRKSGGPHIGCRDPLEKALAETDQYGQPCAESQIEAELLFCRHSGSFRRLYGQLSDP